MSGLGKREQRAIEAYRRNDGPWFFDRWGYRAGDMMRLAGNLAEGKPLCEACEGTGNEFYSMHRDCPKCNGTGALVPATEDKEDDS